PRSAGQAMSAPSLQIIQQVSRAMQCSSCGAEGIAACDCGAPYLPASARAAKAVAANPEKSDRALAAEIGVGSNTVRRARQSTAPSGAVAPVDSRIGLDGKTRRMPKKANDDPEASAEARKAAHAAAADDDGSEPSAGITFVDKDGNPVPE